MATDFGSYYVEMDGRWTLDDLYLFPRTFEQSYFALDALLPSRTGADAERIDRAFTAFPWQGGYSAVNFYNQLKYATPIQARPRVQSIQYASPGWIELALIKDQALTLAAIVASIAGSIAVCNSTYNKIMSDLQRRKLLRIEVERKQIDLSEAELKLVAQYSEEMAQILQIDSAAAVNARTHRPLISLKILLSVYRRMRKLAEYRIKQKAVLPTSAPPQLKPPSPTDLF